MNSRWPIAGLMLFVCTAASAASFEVVSGEGAMNRGLGFQPVTGSVQVSPGATLHAPAGSSAYVVYDNGCRVRVAPGSFTQVKKQAPCGPSSRDLPAEGSVPTQLFGTNQDGSSNLGPIAIGAAALALIVIPVAVLSGRNNDSAFPVLQRLSP